MAFLDRLPGSESVASETNPYNPEVPAAIRDTSPELFEFLQNFVTSVRREHNKTQAGDTSFSWQLMLALDSEQRYTLGSPGRFFHPDFGLIEGIYVQFDSMDPALPSGSPVAFVRNAVGFGWQVTNRLDKSNDKILRGLVASFESPRDGAYGWIITKGINLQSLTVTGKPKKDEWLTWEDSGDLAIGGEALRGVGRVLDESNVQADGPKWKVGAGALFVGPENQGLTTGRGFNPLLDPLGFGEQINEIRQRLELNGANESLALDILNRRVTKLTSDESSIALTQVLQATANFRNLASTAAFNANRSDKLVQVSLSAVQRDERLVRTYRTEAGFFAESSRGYANEAILSANDGKVSAQASQTYSESAKVSADASGQSAEASRTFSQNSATSAGQSSASATQSDQAATRSKTSADGSASSAETSRVNKDASVAAAGQSSASATQSSQSATNAKASADNSAASAETSRGFKDQSQAAAGNSQTSATNSQNFATQANQSSASALNSSSLSAQYRDQALQYRNEAQQDFTGVNARIDNEASVRADRDRAITDITTQQRSDFNGLVTTVTQQSGTLADHTGKLGAFWQVTAMGPGGRAQITVRYASDTGAGVDIVGDVRIFGNLIVFGTVTWNQMAIQTLGQVQSAAATGSARAGEFNQTVQIPGFVIQFTTVYPSGVFTFEFPNTVVTTELTDRVSTVNGRPYYEYIVADGGVYLEGRRPDGTLAVGVRVDGRSGPVIVPVDPNMGATPIRWTAAVVRGGTNTGRIDDGDYYYSYTSQIYTAQGFGAIIRWSSI